MEDHITGGECSFYCKGSGEMAERSKRICLYDAEKAKKINEETLKMFQKYQIDMSIRGLSENTGRRLTMKLKNIISIVSSKETT